MPAERRFTIVILAAQRDGALDPLAAAAGVTHKALVPIGGKPLLVHVLDALVPIETIAAVRISIEAGAEDLLREITDASGLPVRFVVAADNIADSVHRAAEGAEGPVVVTTADNVLLTPEPVRQVADRLLGGDDAVLVLARKEDVLAAHPEAQRNFYEFRDGGFSNCNLYGLSQRGMAMAEAFRSGGQFVKNPMRIARAFGFINLLLLRYGLVSVDAGMRRLSRRFNLKVSALVLSDGAYAVDVDDERTYRIAALLLERRAA